MVKKMFNGETSTSHFIAGNDACTCSTYENDMMALDEISRNNLVKTIIVTPCAMLVQSDQD